MFSRCKENLPFKLIAEMLMNLPGVKQTKSRAISWKILKQAKLKKDIEINDWRGTRREVFSEIGHILFLFAWFLVIGVCSFGIFIELYTCDLCSS